MRATSINSQPVRWQPFMGSLPIKQFDFSRSRRAIADRASSLTLRQTPSLEGFQAFVKVANPRFRWYPHCVKIANVLVRVALGELNRVMIFAPPRHGKSEELSRLFSAYYLSLFPDRWVGINSYAAELAYTLSRSSRSNYQAA